MTLKQGVQNLLCHYIPEVKSVEAIKMSKKIEKLFKSYRDQLLHLAKLYGVVEIKSYARSSKNLLTISQLELLLIKNQLSYQLIDQVIKLLQEQELKENSNNEIFIYHLL